MEQRTFTATTRNVGLYY
uniref:Uncharacterized protein n=1 Tax=Arundo donax TaxID=35708 RepID=A0A0A9BUK2_ARUDO